MQALLTFTRFCILLGFLVLIVNFTLKYTVVTIPLQITVHTISLPLAQLLKMY